MGYQGIHRWPVGGVLTALALSLAAGYAQGGLPPVIDVPGGPPPVIEIPAPGTVTQVTDATVPEESLDRIWIGATMREVMQKTYTTKDGRRVHGNGGMPHYFGPTVGDSTAYLKIFAPYPPAPLPPPLPTPGPVIGPDGKPLPPEPPAPMPELPELALVPVTEYIVWIYLGHGSDPNPKVPYVTYVLFRKKAEPIMTTDPKTGEMVTVGELAAGTVAGVIVRTTKYYKPPTDGAGPADIGTDDVTLRNTVGVLTDTNRIVTRHITFGTRLHDIARRSKLGWSQSGLGTITDGGYNAFFLMYRKDELHGGEDLALTLEANSHRVDCIALGLPLTVTNTDYDIPEPAATPDGLGAPADLGGASTAPVTPGGGPVILPGPAPTNVPK